MLERSRFGAVMTAMIAKSLKANYGQSPKRYGKLLMEQYQHQQHLQMKALKKIEKKKKKKSEENKRQMRMSKAKSSSEKKASTSNKIADDLEKMDGKSRGGGRGRASQIQEQRSRRSRKNRKRRKKVQIRLWMSLIKTCIVSSSSIE